MRLQKWQEMRDVVVPTQDEPFALRHYLADRRVVGAREGEASRIGDSVEQLTDHAAVGHDDDTLIGMRGHDALETAPDPRVELLVRFGAGDDIPAFLYENLFEDRVARRGPAPELAFLPVAEEDLAEVGLFDRCQTEALRERRRGLVRALQRRDV